MNASSSPVTPPGPAYVLKKLLTFLTGKIPAAFGGNTTANIIAATVGGGFAAGGQGFDAAASPLYGAIGAVESDQVPQGDDLMHISGDKMS